MALQTSQNIHTDSYQLYAIFRRERGPDPQESFIPFIWKTQDPARNGGGEHRDDGPNEALNPSSVHLEAAQQLFKESNT